MTDFDFERTIAPEALRILADLPLLLNSSLDTKRIISVALDQVSRSIKAEAATVFLRDEGGSTLTFWALRGHSTPQLEGKKMSAQKGIVGWVMSKREPVLVNDAQNDPRLFKEIDAEGKFTTRNMLCVPLIVRGKEVIGAIQILNKEGSAEFTRDELYFLEQFSHQLALAIENAKLHQAVLQRNYQLELLDKRKNEVIAVIAHEFKTPLNVVLSSAQMLASGMLADPALTAKTAETLGNGIQRLTRLISQIKDMLLVGAADVPLNRSAVASGDLLKKVAAAFEAPLAKRKLSFEVSAALPALAVDADEVLLHVVLRNLLANAIRFTPDGGKITLAAQANAGLLHFSVSDTGIGIAPEHMQVIFEKFYEVTPVMFHSSGEYEFKSCGLGLGLPAAQAIIKAHGSVIEVESTPGKGSTFKFALPQAGL